MRLVGEAYWWWKDSHSSCWYSFVLQDLLRIRPHLLFTDFKETLESFRKIIEGMVINVDIDSEPPILVEPEIIEDSQKWKSQSQKWRASYWDFCKSSSRAYYGVSVIFDSYILEIAWHLRLIADLTIGDRFTGDWCLGMCVSFQWS